MVARDALLLALDLGKTTGYCFGPLDELMPAGSIYAAGAGMGPHDGAAKLARWLRDRIERNGCPVEIAVEEQLPPGAMKGGEATVWASYLHGAVAAVAGCYNIPLVAVYNQTWRKSFTGKGRWGGRDAGKLAVYEAAVARGYLSKGDFDYDAADAAGIYEHRRGLLLRGVEPGEKA